MDVFLSTSKIILRVDPCNQYSSVLRLDEYSQIAKQESPR